MLAALKIRNLAVIDEADFEFAPGLNVLTGETGAGKTIVMSALALLSGARASSDIVRAGAREATVDGLFELGGGELELLGELGDDVLAEDTGELLVRRTLSEGGRSRITVNGRPFTVQLLARLAASLVHVFGQHEQQTLRQPENHLAIIDRYAGLEEDLAEYHRVYREALALNDELKELDRLRNERARLLDYLRFEVDELERAALVPGEDVTLAAERRVLANASRLIETAAEAERLLYGAEGAAHDSIAQAQALLKEAAAFDDRFRRLLDLLEEARAVVEEAGLELRSYAEKIEADPERLNKISQRLEQLQRIKRKYGSLEAALQELDKARAEIEKLERLDDNRNELAARLNAALAELTERASRLSAARRAAAHELKRRFEAELKTLGINHPRFEPRFTARRAGSGAGLSAQDTVLGANGIDDVEFLISANLGQPPMPLAKVASGGELSRIMLALKCLEARRRGIATLVFDEVDAGIGGAVAEVVGRKLKQLSAYHQILCVTHLAQIAAFADRHFVVEKFESRGATVSRVAPLEGDRRVSEIARMMAGARPTAQMLGAARELLQRAQADSANLRRDPMLNHDNSRRAARAD